MRYLVLADLHSNLEALEAALERARPMGYDRVLVLGDIVGYGPDPTAVIERLASLREVVAIRGNHDRVAAGQDGEDEFNDAARAAALWTRSALSPGAVAYLKALPEGPLEFAPGRFLSHGTPLDEDEYLLDEGGARRCFDALRFDLCFFGHTHLPCEFRLEGLRVEWRAARGERTEFSLEAGRRHLINPGSIGQPRDRDPRCGFAIYDAAAGTVTLHRVAYPHATTSRKILQAGLPAWLAERLRFGV
jgi:diadenosine tetraphosphatase ApaH/serine/threonine PP2A family protein phosphatase